ncbi:hypothetical protein ACEXQE_11805 [Herbiconiux sp. P17]|uniref:hypothetical protein n=1 Tax=Herbiconiux wuyangfengii TaxID=3342794 RepID=UPI0035BAA6CB
MGEPSCSAASRLRERVNVFSSNMQQRTRHPPREKSLSSSESARIDARSPEGVDSTYLVCADDRSTSIELQRFHAARATRSVELPTGHHPFLTRPDLVVEQVQTLVTPPPRP